ncbi:undecaprenyl-diphosphate phosphatase [Rossellomorea aquimaris]|uniref:Undecaprenyl-diphosphatase n=1 Tax=Rossellomorea aquimaris TaxID=189382 RepID=A0A5D4UCF2_9BACI|nr:undecaprenyl-diphosphate phosphatase [Rossellomorea aquimaris]TYS79013.1 undecaprenyl-diphosphate phosphatase [Rossellomorea aquimaris]TYS84758.1 undecaprenyl-diphosphate phosphatase [Rossellomorea aquimaris]
MDVIMLIKAFILGMVEGLTEFAPVSSTGHMIVVDDLWIQSKEVLGKYPANTFKVVIQLGSILAVVIVFRERFKDLLGFKHRTANKSSNLKLTHILTGLIPAVILGLLFEDYIDEHLFSLNTVLAGLTIGAFLMIAADLFRPKIVTVENVDQITHKKALVIGLIQCLSLWPGFSRSGSTISGGVLLGLSYRAASDFTFIMAVPIMLGASSLSLMKNWMYFTPQFLPFLLVGFLSAFLFAYLSIHFFLKVINKIKLIPFAIYRLVLVAIIFLVFI